MKSIQVPGGIVHLAESKATCPHCTRSIPFDEIEERFAKSTDGHIRMKCLCKRYIGATMNIVGDFVAYELNAIKPKQL